MEEFIKGIREEVFTETDLSIITPGFIFKDGDEWDSLTALSLIAHFDTNLGMKISGEQIINANTIKDLYEIACA